MTIKQFQERYHEYQTENEQEALVESMKLKVVRDDGKVEPVYPVNIDGKWCLMLNSAAKLLEDMRLI